MEKLTAEEIDVAKEIINIGLSKAADSMAFFTREKVFIRSSDLIFDDILAIDKLSQKPAEELLYVLTTQVEGEMEGVCYLLFSEAEVMQIAKTSLPPSILDDFAKRNLMVDALLLEMDNIIAASVITQFANFFDYKMHGGVPSISKSISNGFTQLIHSTSKTEQYVLYFKSEFITTGMDINPEFVWLLNKKYIDGVKLIVQNNSKLSLLKKGRLC